MGNYYLVGNYGVFYGVMKNFETRELMLHHIVNILIPTVHFKIVVCYVL